MRHSGVLLLVCAGLLCEGCGFFRDEEPEPWPERYQLVAEIVVADTTLRLSGYGLVAPNRYQTIERIPPDRGSVQFSFRLVDEADSVVRSDRLELRYGRDLVFDPTTEKIEAVISGLRVTESTVPTFETHFDEVPFRILVRY